VKDAIHSGNTWALKWRYPGIFDSEDIDPSVMTEVANTRFDGADRLRYEVGPLRTGPGREVTAALGLQVKRESPRTWTKRVTVRSRVFMKHGVMSLLLRMIAAYPIPSPMDGGSAQTILPLKHGTRSSCWPCSN
jgi:hypothetical protein